MILTYYPDTDILDVDFGLPRQGENATPQEAQEAAQVLAGAAQPAGDTETYDAEPTGQTRAHYFKGRLEGLTIEHASRRAPAAWKIGALRREAARVAASTGRIVEHVRYDLVGDAKSMRKGQAGPHSPHTSDEAVREYNRLIDRFKETAAA